MQDFRLAGIVFLASTLFVLLGFEVAQHLAIQAGQIPPRGTHTWNEKPFLHWDSFKVQLVGDALFLSALNASVFHVARKTVTPDWSTVAIATAVLILAAVVTAIWLHSVQSQFAAGKFNRWDWGFTHPKGELTIAGKFHLGYFWVETAVIGVALVLMFCVSNWTDRLMLIVPIAGYVATAIYDAIVIGLSGGPFAGPKQIG